MRRFFLIIFCLLFKAISLYSQGYNPKGLDLKGLNLNRNNSVFSDVVDELNRQHQQRFSEIVDILNSAIKAMEDEKYTDAINLFDEVLRQIYQEGYESDFSEYITKISQLREVCKKQNNNLYDNKYYRMIIGNILCVDYSLRPIYAYGKNNSVSFIAIKFSNFESIIIPDYLIFDFAQLLEKLIQEVYSINTSKDKQKVSQDFPTLFSVYYVDISFDNCLHNKILKIGPMNNRNTKEYAAGISLDGKNNPFLLYTKDNLKYLNNFVDNLYNCESSFRKEQKEKVADDDLYLNLFSHQ